MIIANFVVTWNVAVTNVLLLFHKDVIGQLFGTLTSVGGIISLIPMILFNAGVTVKLVILVIGGFIVVSCLHFIVLFRFDQREVGVVVVERKRPEEDGGQTDTTSSE